MELPFGAPGAAPSVGGLLSVFSQVESLGDGSSRCRNPRLMSLMGAVPLEHGGFIAESQGTGIRYMIREMEARSLPVPEFRVTADSFTVILRRELPGVVAVPAPAPVSPSMDTYFLEEKILLELDARRPTSARELAERIGVGVARIRYLLPKLIEQGKVAPTAGETSRNRRYVLVS